MTELQVNKTPELRSGFKLSGSTPVNEILKNYFKTNDRTVLANQLRAAGIKTVAFDMDGTLVDTEEYCCKNIAAVINDELGIELTEAEIESIPVGRRSQDICEKLLLPKGIDLETITETAKKVTPRYQSGLAEEIEKSRIQAFPKIMQLVKDLYQEDFPLAIVTSNTRMIAEMQIAKNNLAGHFKLIISKEDCPERKYSKPSPYPYNKAITKLKVKPDEVLVIEDSNSGIESSSSAGTRVIALRNKTNQQAFSDQLLARENVELLDMTKL